MLSIFSIIFGILTLGLSIYQINVWYNEEPANLILREAAFSNGFCGIMFIILSFLI